MPTTNTDERLFNPMISHVITNEVEVKTVDGYYHQIKTNLYLQTKSEFIIARDLHEANVTLSPVDYDKLLDMLKFSESTESKYLSIGKDDRLNKLFIAGKLPFKWTTQYFLTTLTDAEFEKVAEKIDPDMTKSKIAKLAEISDEKKKAIETLLFKFLNLEVDISEVKPDRFDAMISEITDYLKNFPEIKVDDQKVSDIKNKIDNYTPKQTTKNANESKSDEITAEDVADVVNDDVSSLDEHLKESEAA